MTLSEIKIRDANVHDAKGICAIYNHYVRESIATFDLEERTPESFFNQIKSDLPYFVAEFNESILGYTYASEWNPRPAYRYSVESSVYLHPESTGKGIGSLLYTTLFENLKKNEIHSIIGGISLPNVSSVRLHEKFGFKQVCEYKEVGFKFNKWIDVGYWQLILPFDPSV